MKLITTIAIVSVLLAACASSYKPTPITKPGDSDLSCADLHFAIQIARDEAAKRTQLFEQQQANNRALILIGLLIPPLIVTWVSLDRAGWLLEEGDDYKKRAAHLAQISGSKDCR